MAALRGATTRIRIGLATALAAAAASAGFGQGGAGVVGKYQGYAYADCSEAKTPIVRIVLVQGAVPAGIPAAPPRPSIELVLHGGVQKAVGQTVSVSADALTSGSGGAAITCPVVGWCSTAVKGTIQIESRAADGGVAGKYQAAWRNGQPRSGQFSAAWRESTAKCS
jgi:hypothetical protein